VQQHLGRQAGVQKAEVSLRDGLVEVTPKEDGQIDPSQLLKAVYDSGVSVVEMSMTARGRVTKDPAGGFSLQVSPARSFAIEPGELEKSLEAVAGTGAQITLRALLYKKPVGKKKGEQPVALKLVVLEIQKRE